MSGEDSSARGRQLSLPGSSPSPELDSLSMLISNTTDASPTPESDGSLIARELETIAARIVQHVTDHDWDHPDFEEFMSPEYSAYQEYYCEQPLARSREEFLTHYKAFVEANPNYGMQILSIAGHVNEKNGTAAVWMHLRVKGHPVNVWRESVTVVHWKRRQGKWTCERQNGVRGVGWFR